MPLGKGVGLPGVGQAFAPATGRGYDAWGIGVFPPPKSACPDVHSRMAKTNTRTPTKSPMKSATKSPSKPAGKSAAKAASKPAPKAIAKVPAKVPTKAASKPAPKPAAAVIEPKTATAGATASTAPATTRVEKDTMGEMVVPAHVLYGASTQRAVLNFPVSGRPVPEAVIKAYAVLKGACAIVNNRLGRLDDDRTRAILEACGEINGGLVSFGGIATHFPVDVYQTGSGTSTNMNANEVIANLICVRRHLPIGSSKDTDYLAKGGVHPNDHVNMGQSSNDTFPTAMHIAAAVKIREELLPAVARLAEGLEEKAKAWDKIVKIGRTHLQDATSSIAR